MENVLQQDLIVAAERLNELWAGYLDWPLMEVLIKHRPTRSWLANRIIQETHSRFGEGAYFRGLHRACPEAIPRTVLQIA